MNDITLPLLSVNRHRLGIDGQGVTTLVGAFGCPLKCRYCINPEAWNTEILSSAKAEIRHVTPEELLEMVQIDHLYFLATGGGIVFGGGESLLHPDFIRAFRQICPPQWRLTVETSLNVPSENLAKVLDTVDDFIVDVKDLNPDIYRSYTGSDNSQVLKNLKTLRENTDSRRVTVRVPLIPRFNRREDIEQNVCRLREMGFTQLDVFSYVMRSSSDKKKKVHNSTFPEMHSDHTNLQDHSTTL